MRSTAGVAVMAGRLYVVGGRDGSVCHRSVEVFDPHTNKWTMRAPMNKRRGGVGVGVANGYLYALGGHDCPASNPSVLRTETVERYDPGTDTWTLVRRRLAGRLSHTQPTLNLFPADRLAERRSRRDRRRPAGRLPDRRRRLRRQPVPAHGRAVRSGRERVDAAGRAELQSGRRLRGGRAQLPAAGANGAVETNTHMHFVFVVRVCSHARVCLCALAKNHLCIPRFEQARGAEFRVSRDKY